MRQLSRLWSAVIVPGGLRAALTWPVFSITSFHLVHGLRRLGIQPRTVIDIGANIGQFACAAENIFRPMCLLSFEPNPQIFSKLRENLSTLPSARLFAKGLGATSGTMDLRVNAHSHSSSFLKLADSHRRAFPEAVEVGEIRVQVSTLDEEIGDEDLPQPVLLKIDVQGFEAEVIRGARSVLAKVDWVVVETSFVSLYQGEPIFMEVARALENRGFHFRCPVGWLSHPKTDQVLQMDALFVRPSLGGT